MTMSVSPDTSMMCDSISDEDEIESQESEDEFLDEICLEPITSVHGCSRLCNACLLILKLSAWKELSHSEIVLLRHLRYWTTLRSSAERGCLLCIYLLDRWKGSEDVYEATALVRSQARLVFGDHEVLFECSMSGFAVVFYLVNPACKSHSICNPIQVLPRHSNISSGSNDTSQ